MKRDMDLARTILLLLEEHSGAKRNTFITLDLPERTSEEVSYHVQLLHEAGLLFALDVSTTASTEWVPMRLTWAGHEFLDAVRSDTVWNKTKGLVLEKTGGLSFEALKFAVHQLMKGLLT